VDGATFGPRPAGSRRPHTDGRVAAVRALIEQTTLTYSEIAQKTGVGRASICRWTADHGWQRPPFAPRATDTVPSVRAGRRLKLRRLAERLHLLAERYLRELEASAGVDLDKLMQALEVVKMARLEAMGRHRDRRGFWAGEPRTGAQTLERDDAIRAALKEMRRGGVDLSRAPQEALDLVIDAATPLEGDHPALRERGRRRKK
jgi:transcriptional regulator with XRE-family HTH domain